MKFNIDDYKGKYVMHCGSEEEAKDFCRYLDSLGRKWSDGTKYTELTFWCVYKDNTCYDFNNGKYYLLSCCESKGYTILEWSDFMEKKFTKSDLKNGDIILRGNGKVEIVCLETGTLISLEHFNSLDNINENLTSFLGDIIFDNGWDVVAVRRPKKPSDCQFTAFDKGYGELVYERKDKPEEMTLKEVCEALGKEIKIVKEH